MSFSRSSAPLFEMNSIGEDLGRSEVLLAIPLYNDNLFSVYSSLCTFLYGNLLEPWLTGFLAAWFNLITEGCLVYLKELLCTVFTWSYYDFCQWPFSWHSFPSGCTFSTLSPKLSSLDSWDTPIIYHVQADFTEKYISEPLWIGSWTKSCAGLRYTELLRVFLICLMFLLVPYVWQRFSAQQTIESTSLLLGIR